MKKLLGIIVLGLLLSGNAYADKCYNPVATPLILESDKKPGRFFEDQPDVNDDYQIHIVYSLLKDSKDKEGDINGAIEKLNVALQAFGQNLPQPENNTSEATNDDDKSDEDDTVDGEYKEV